MTGAILGTARLVGRARAPMLILLAACTSDPITLDPKGGDDTDVIDTADTSDTDTADTDTTDTGAPISAFSLTVDSDVVTMVHATWRAPRASSATVEYRFDGGEWAVAPTVADGAAVLLGIPAEMRVEARVAAVIDGATVTSETATVTTGTLPDDLLLPDVVTWEEAKAYDAPYAMISVAGGNYTYEGPYWVEIFDREGRIVWYHEVPDDLLCFYPSVALDGTHLWYDADTIFVWGEATPQVTRMTLDGRWEKTLEVEGMGQAVGEGPDGTFFYEHRSGNQHQLRQLAADGAQTTIWDCSSWMRAEGEDVSNCEMNTTNWSPEHNSVMTSMFLSDTVWEIDLDSGEPILQAGQATYGDPWTFSPSDSVFDYQHNPYWLDNGHLLVSTHKRGKDGIQIAAEYAVDEDTQTLTRVWDYTSTDLWATQVGESIRLPNGNTTQGYGQDGAVREVTSDGDVVWEVSWPRDGQGDRVVGHLSLIPDLYALNVGPE